MHDALSRAVRSPTPRASSHCSNKQYAITSIIRTEDHIADITAAAISSSVTPLVLSLEHSPVSAFTEAISGADTVVFSAGAGGKGGPDRTRIVDYEGAVKVYNAIEAVPEKSHISCSSAGQMSATPIKYLHII